MLEKSGLSLKNKKEKEISWQNNPQEVQANSFAENGITELLQITINYFSCWLY